MDDPGIFVHFNKGDGETYIPLPNPCVLDCGTQAGFISLILDRTYPHYLFVHIDGEPRQCVDLSEYNLAFETDKDVHHFLRKVSASEWMDDLIHGESSMNCEWQNL